MTLVNSRPELMNLSFSGCGFLCVYHAGVAAAIKEYAPQLLQNKVLGASAGSIVACGLITNVCISHATTTILKVVSQARARTLGPLHPEFDLLGIVRDELRRILPANSWQLCTGRLVISLTRWSDHENVIIDEYRSNEDLIDAIMCSCFIPLYCGFTPPKFRGIQYIDGGVTDNQPIYDENTVTVSPFSGESDICPPDWDSASLLGLDFNGTSIRFTARNMFRLMACLWPRSTEDLSKMCLQGFEDALRFLTKNGMAPCIRCLTIQTVEGGALERISSDLSSDIEETVSSGGRRCGGVVSPSSIGATLGTGLTRFRKRSSGAALNSRNRGESECETCCDSDLLLEDVNVNKVFPSIMRKPFDEAVAAEKSMFQYILSFKVMRFAMTALGVGKLPLDVALAFARNVKAYLAKVSPPQWFLLKMQGLADFILSEVDKQKSRYTNFSCHVAVTEVDRYSSDLSSSAWDQQEEREIELSEEAKKELKLLRERDRMRRRQQQRKTAIVSSLPNVAEIPSSSLSNRPSTSSAPAVLDAYEDIDSFEHVVDFSRTHDAMYEFHYRDENNTLRSFELFNVRASPRHPSLTSGASSSMSSCVPSRKLVHVPEEDEESLSAQTSSSSATSTDVVTSSTSTVENVEANEKEMDEIVSEARKRSTTVDEDEDEEERDSGLSGVETRRDDSSMSSPSVQQQQATASSKRDACCSPVRDFSSTDMLPVMSSSTVSRGGTASSSASSSSRGKQAQRRHTMDAASTSRKQSLALAAKKKATHVAVSSDSEEVDGTEKLFVPSRKAWRASSEYDKEDGDVSDTETA